MAARLAPDHVRRMHQSLHHLVADAPWDDQEMLEPVRQQVLPAMQKHGPVVAWIIDDTAFPKQGSMRWGLPGRTAGSWANRRTARRRWLVGEHVEFEFADRVAIISAGSVVSGCGPLPAGRGPGRSGLSNQARDCGRADSTSDRTGGVAWEWYEKMRVTERARHFARI